MSHQTGLKFITHHELTKMVPGFGLVPIYLSLYEGIGLGEATPRPFRYLVIADCGGFGVTVYASRLIQHADPLAALDLATAQLRLGGECVGELVDEWLRHKLDEQEILAHSGGKVLTGSGWSVVFRGKPDDAPTQAPGTQQYTET